MFGMKRRNTRRVDSTRYGFQPCIEALEDRLVPCCPTWYPIPAVYVPDFYSTPANMPASGNLTANDQLVYGPPTVLTQPLHGRLDVVSYGDSRLTFTYTPDPGFIGIDTFTYGDWPSFQMVENPGAPATVTIAVGVEDVPLLYRLSISDTSVIEGDSGTTDAVFTVSLSESSPLPVTVNYATGTGPFCYSSDCSDTAAAYWDFMPTSGTLTFSPCQTTQSITVHVVGDIEIELDEYFYVDLSTAVNAGINDGIAVGTIIDDDTLPPPELSISDVSKREGNSGTTAFVFTVTLSAPGTQTVTVNYATYDGTATTGTDYTAVSGTLTFAPGETTKTIAVQVKGDRTKEADETFYLNLSGATNVAIADAQAIATILNDDKN